MANPQLSIRIAANLDDLRKNITEGKNIIGEVTPAVEKLAKTWTTHSQAMVQDAVNVTSAMAGMKGGTELTARDAAAALKKLQDGMAQLVREGQPIPPLMQQTADKLRAAGAGAATFADQLKAAIPTAGSLTTQIQAMALGYVTGTLALAGFEKAGRAVYAFVVSSIKAYTDSEDAQRRLVTALVAQGTATPAVIAQYTALAEKYQLLTVNSDELIKETETLLAQVGGVMPAQMDLALAAVTDLAAGLGIDLRSATLMVAKSFEDNFGALKKAGVTIDESRAKAEGMTYVLGQLQQRFGGQARSEMQSYAGQVKQLGNQWDDFKEQVGGAVLKTGLLQTVLAIVRAEVTKATLELKTIIATMRALAAIPGPMGAPFRALGFEFSDVGKKAANYGQDVNLASVSTLSFASQLAAATVKMLAIEPATKAEIVAMLALGKNTEFISEKTGLAAEVIELFKDRLKDQETATKKAQEAAKKHKEEMVEWGATVTNLVNVPLTAWLKSLDDITLRIPAHLVAAKAASQAHQNLGVEITTAVEAMVRMGLSSSDIAKRLKDANLVTDDGAVAVKMFADQIRDASKAIEAHIVPLKDFLATLPNVTLKLDASKVAAREVAEAHRQLSPSVAGAAREMFTAGLSADAVFKALKAAGQVTDDDKPKIEALAKANTGLTDTLDDLSKSFAQMAQIGGDSFSGIAKGAGLVVSSLGAGVKAADGIQKAFAAIDLNGGKGWSVQNVAALGSSVLGLIGVMFQAASAANMLSDAIGEDDKWKITRLSMADFNSELQLSQSTIEALLPVWQRMSVVRLAEGLSSDQARANAEALKLTLIIKDLGGVSNLTSDQLAIVFERIDSLLTMATGKSEFARDAVKELDEAFKEMVASGTDSVGLISQALVDLIAKEQELGVTTASVAAYRLEQTVAAEAGISQALGVSSAAYSAQQMDIIKLAELNTRLGETTDEAQRAVIQQAIEATNADLLVQQGILSATAITSQQEAAAVAGAEIAAIDAKVQAGSTWISAILSQKTEIQALAAELTRSGISGGAAFDLITRELDLATNAVAGPALTAMSGYTQAIVGLNNSGMLTGEMFGGLVNRIGVTEQALEAQGFTSAEVMGAMQKDLQVAWELQDRFPGALDATTQALVDEAEAQGVVGETHKSTTEQMLDLTRRMTEALEKMAGIVRADAGGAFKDLGDQAGVAFDRTIQGAQDAEAEIQRRFRDLSFTVPVEYDYGNAPTNPGDSGGDSGYAARGGLVTGSGVRYLAGGGFLPRGSDTVPAMLTPGEGIVSRRGMDVLGVSGLRSLNRGQAPTISTAALEARLASIETLLANQPRAMKLAMKEAMVMA